MATTTQGASPFIVQVRTGFDAMQVLSHFSPTDTVAKLREEIFSSDTRGDADASVMKLVLKDVASAQFVQLNDPSLTLSQAGIGGTNVVVNRLIRGLR